MKIAVIGGGGREHALIKKLKESPLCGDIYALPGNGGIAEDAACVPIGAVELDKIVNFCVENAIEYVVVAPDDPLALGLVDRLAEVGIPAFGPTAAAARIESSKVFSKELMCRYHIPTADYAVFTQAGEALDYIRTRNRYPVVVKADGLALGKGVLICEDEEAARRALSDMLEAHVFGRSGDRVVVEEFLTGPEVSVLCFTDGKSLLPMASSMDHKRALDGDRGLNTGGMGTVAPNPFYTEEIARRCMEEIFLPTIRAMSKEGCPFKGCLYFGLMLTPDGPKVIEYNCRFGDPETQVVLPLLEGDLLEIMQAVTEERLTPELMRIRKGHAACVILASGGYPSAYKKGLPITGTELAKARPGVQVFHAGTRLDEGTLVTSGGRVLGISAIGSSLQEALDSAYSAASLVHFENIHMRRDIGQRALSACSDRADKNA